MPELHRWALSDAPENTKDMLQRWHWAAYGARANCRPSTVLDLRGMRAEPPEHDRIPVCTQCQRQHAQAIARASKATMPAGATVAICASLILATLIYAGAITSAYAHTWATRDDMPPWMFWAAFGALLLVIVVAAFRHANREDRQR